MIFNIKMQGLTSKPEVQFLTNDETFLPSGLTPDLFFLVPRTNRRIRKEICVPSL